MRSLKNFQLTPFTLWEQCAKYVTSPTNILFPGSQMFGIRDSSNSNLGRFINFIKGTGLFQILVLIL